MEKLFHTKAFAKGSFTKAYKALDGTQVKLISSCPVKECMSLFPFESNMFPPIERTDTEEYLMKFYPRVRSLKQALDADQYEIYKELCKMFRSTMGATDIDMSYDVWYRAFGTLSNEDVKYGLKEALDTLANYGTDFAFEISPRNVAVDNGKLVLLDVFFSQRKLIEIRTK